MQIQFKTKCKQTNYNYIWFRYNYLNLKSVKIKDVINKELYNILYYIIINVISYIFKLFRSKTLL